MWTAIILLISVLWFIKKAARSRSVVVEGIGAVLAIALVVGGIYLGGVVLKELL